MSKTGSILFAGIVPALIVLAVCNPAKAQGLSGSDVAMKAQQAFYQAGSDLKARVVMELVSGNGKVRTRELTMLRLNTSDAGEQKYYMYFHQPSDVRAMAFLVWKYAGRDDDRWLYVPAIKQAKRIAADDKHASFVGSDFSYEDISGRNVADDNHTVQREEPVNGRAAYVLESVPKDAKSAQYSRKVSWVDKETFLPLKEEYYDKRGQLYKTFTAERSEAVQGIPTILKRTMTNAQNGHRTEVTFSEVSYNVGLKDDLFSERYLRSAPTQWIQ